MLLLPKVNIIFLRLRASKWYKFHNIEACATLCTLLPRVHQNTKIPKSLKFDNFLTMGLIEDMLADLSL